jgi:hypothetical protein
MPGETVQSRLTSRKFWALVATLMGSAWACRWMLSNLVDLMDRAKISHSVFENLCGLIITSEAIFAAAIVGWWMGANVLQKFVYLKNGGK